jgi:hypothetical protein
MSQTRRLAAILAADVAGYSRLMGESEMRGASGSVCWRLEQPQTTIRSRGTKAGIRLLTFDHEELVGRGFGRPNPRLCDQQASARWRSCLVEERIRTSRVQCEPADPKQARLLNTPLTINGGIRMAPPGISLPPPVLRCPLPHEMSKCGSHPTHRPTDPMTRP